MKDCNVYLRLIKTLVEDGMEEEKAFQLIHNAYPEISLKILYLIYHKGKD